LRSLLRHPEPFQPDDQALGLGPFLRGGPGGEENVVQEGLDGRVTAGETTGLMTSIQIIYGLIDAADALLSIRFAHGGISAGGNHFLRSASVQELDAVQGRLGQQAMGASGCLLLQGSLSEDRRKSIQQQGRVQPSMALDARLRGRWEGQPAAEAGLTFAPLHEAGMLGGAGGRPGVLAAGQRRRP
jgi:hypothetical protein